ncbi:MAG: TetR/AcrR family transcriptional regulator [Anaerolineaceae bacterium]
MGTTREKRHDQTRQKIMETTLELIASEGLDNFSLRKLANMIDYSPAAIYKYFASKEDILEAIRADFWQKAGQQEPDISDLTPPEQLLASGENYMAFAEAYPQHYLLVFNSPATMPGSLEDMYQDPRFSGLIAIVRDGVERGFFKLPEGYSPESMAIHLWISVHGIVMLRFTIMKEHREEFTRLAGKTMTDFIHSFSVK